MPTEKLQLAIVGFGPRGLSVAERLCANAESLLTERELLRVLEIRIVHRAERTTPAARPSG